MKTSPGYRQGGDAQAIRKIANKYYGGYREMFESHEWPERGNKFIPAVQSRVVEAYGSVRAFEEAHARNDLMSPMEAITAELPNVWLTSYYGFRPEDWGLLGFTDIGMRSSFIEDTKPGVLVVIYGTNKAAKDERQRILGIQQCSHERGTAKQFMSPAIWE